METFKHRPVAGNLLFFHARLFSGRCLVNMFHWEIHYVEQMKYPLEQWDHCFYFKQCTVWVHRHQRMFRVSVARLEPIRVSAITVMTSQQNGRSFMFTTYNTLFILHWWMHLFSLVLLSCQLYPWRNKNTGYPKSHSTRQQTTTSPTNCIQSHTPKWFMHCCFSWNYIYWSCPVSLHCGAQRNILHSSNSQENLLRWT